MLIDTDNAVKRRGVSEFGEHNINTTEFSETANSKHFLSERGTEIVTFFYPFDPDAVSLWRQWLRRDGRITHGMDPDVILPFLATERGSSDALLIMELKHARCQLAVVVVPDTTSTLCSAQSWQLYTHEHLDVSGFFEEKADQSYDMVFDFVQEGLSNNGINLSRLSIFKMQCLNAGRKLFSEKYVRFNAFFDLSGKAVYSIPGKLNRNIRRNSKKLADSHGPLVLEVAPSQPDNMNTFFDVEASGWKGRERSSIRSDDRLRRAYLAAARDGGSCCRAHVFTLWAGHEAVSSAFGLVYGEHITLLKIGFDERFTKFSPGSLLISKVINHAAKIGSTKLFLSTYPDWAIRWKTNLQIKKDVYVFSDDWTGRFRYLVDRFAKPVIRLQNLLLGKGDSL
ncbi:MAG: GNAT family N-acetyltransferase [Woeseia sp.]|nr:GNAT family N-acetyltransferase [Woeseia sp.]MBT6210780.1 GNAT family N-acetyltransferase [Woeseia sp.]